MRWLIRCRRKGAAETSDWAIFSPKATACSARRRLYVERRGVRASIAELSQHECLVLRDNNQAFGGWRLVAGGWWLVGPNGSEKIKVSERLSSKQRERASTRLRLVVLGEAQKRLVGKWLAHAESVSRRGTAPNRIKSKFEAQPNAKRTLGEALQRPASA